MLAWNELLTDLTLHEILHRHFRPLQNRKLITAKWLTHGKQLQEVAVWGKLKKPPSSRPILIYFEFRSKPSLITVICMNPHLPNKFQSVATKYCFLILREDTCFFFLIISLFCVIFCYYTLLLIFTKNILLLLFHYIFFFMKIIFIFACFGMFRDVPECSGMFRHVAACSVFRVLSTAWKKVHRMAIHYAIDVKLNSQIYFYLN